MDEKDILFENRFTRDEEIFRDFVKDNLFRSLGNVAFYVLIVVILIGGVVLALMGYLPTGPEMGQTYLMMAGVMAVWVVIMYLRYPMTVKRLVKHDQEIAGDAGVDQVVTVTEKNLYLESVRGKIYRVIELGDFTKGKKYGSVLYLRTYKAEDVLLRRDSFTKGTEEEFIEFLRKNKIRVW